MPCWNTYCCVCQSEKVKYYRVFMKPKRRVSSNLGRTQHRQADALYAQIRKRIGLFRHCPFYHGKKYTQLSPEEHNKLNTDFPNPDVPIQQFDFSFKKEAGYWDLQSYCKICFKAYRDARIAKSRTTWTHADCSPMNEGEIRSLYLANVGPTMRCSVCTKELTPNHFAISRSMEKGLHNECVKCQIARANSVREQEWLADGDWSSWTHAVRAIRRQKRVSCAGWSRSVETHTCEKSGAGKNMHMDHIIPLRAGGIHDKRNLQPLCTQCNSKKSDQIDPASSVESIITRISASYSKAFLAGDSISTIERKLKNALVERIGGLITKEMYRSALRAKKREVNGQWSVTRAERKGKEWFSRTQKGLGT